MSDYPTPSGPLTPEDLALVTSEALRHIRRVKPSGTSWDEGMVWYQRANQFCRDLAAIVGKPWDALGWALAALSPMNSWKQNRLDLVDLVTTGDCGALGNCRHKAIRILSGEPHYQVIGGKKVSAFGDNIVDPTHSRKVTLDRHMTNLLGMPDRYLERAGVYEATATAFRRSAAGRGIRPHQLQAALWVEARGNHE